MNYCPACGKRLEAAMDFCSRCGRKLESIAGPYGPDDGGGESRSSTLVIDKADPTFYMNDEGLRVTATRLVVPAKKSNEGPSTYSMANITSIKSEKSENGRIAGALVAVLGIVIIVARDYLALSSAATIGVVLLIAGFLIAVIMRPSYQLKVASASGEFSALKTHKKEEFDRILSAINEALIKRG